MQVSKQETAPCTYKLEIELDAAAVRRGFGRAYKDFSQFTRVPGFRPGHAPRAVLDRYVNHERLREHVMELLVRDAYREALAAESIDPYDEPDFTPGDLVDGEPWRFEVTVAGQPRVQLGDYTSLTVERPVMAVTDADVERSADTVRGENAELRSVTDRGVQADDVLIVDMAIAMEGQEPAQPQRSIVRLAQTIPGFAEAVAGQRTDEARSFSLTFPHDYDDPARAGQTAEFRVTVASINERVLPDVTDEWVGRLGHFESVEAWRQSLRADLEKRMNGLADEVATSRIVQQLVEGSRIEFPPAMLDAEVQRNAARLSEELRRNETTYEQYLEMTKLSREEHQARMEAEAETAVRTRLVLREFARAESMELDESEVETRYIELRDGAANAGLRLAGDETDQRTRVANRLLQEKLREKLLGMATVTDVEVKAGD
jgi:trigger factor